MKQTLFQTHCVKMGFLASSSHDALENNSWALETGKTPLCAGNKAVQGNSC